MMKLVVLIFSCVLAFAQSEDRGKPPLVQEGHLFQIRLEPGNKNLKVFLVGKQGVELDWKNAQLRATLEMGSKKRQLKLVKKDDHFRIEDEIPSSEKFNLKIQATGNGQTETYKFEIGPK